MEWTDSQLIGLFAIFVYCAWQTVNDFRRKNYKMAVFGLACVLALSFGLPTVTRTISIDLPASSS